MRKMIFIFLVFVVPFLGGCFEFYGHEKYQFTVLDAEDQTPIERASVRVSYWSKPFVLNCPGRNKAFTDQSGTVEFKVADYYPRFLRVDATGYVQVSSSFSVHPMGPNFLRARDGNEMLVLLYKQPRPRIEVVVPNGYRGPVGMEYVSLDEMVQGKPGQRVFTVKADSLGYAKVEMSHMFHSVGASGVYVRYENGVGVQTSNYYSPVEIGLRQVAHRGNKQLYVVGTEKDVLDFKSAQFPGLGAAAAGVSEDDFIESFFNKQK